MAVSIAAVERFRNGFDATSGLVQAALLGELNWVNGQQHARAVYDGGVWAPGIAATIRDCERSIELIIFFPGAVLVGLEGGDHSRGCTGVPSPYIGLRPCGLQMNILQKLTSERPAQHSAMQTKPPKI